MQRGGEGTPLPFPSFPWIRFGIRAVPALEQKGFGHAPQGSTGRITCIHLTLNEVWVAELLCCPGIELTWQPELHCYWLNAINLDVTSFLLMGTFISSVFSKGSRKEKKLSHNTINISRAGSAGGSTLPLLIAKGLKTFSPSFCNFFTSEAANAY